jgi:K+-sensing histidine kinase KdpD
LVTDRQHQAPKRAVMACLTANGPCNGELLRQAQAAAREQDGELYAVLVDSGSSWRRKLDTRELLDSAVVANCFGARFVPLEGSDAVGELIRYARQTNVGRIFVARDRRSRFFRPLRRTVYSDLLSRGDGFRIDVVGFENLN